MSSYERMRCIQYSNGRLSVSLCYSTIGDKNQKTWVGFGEFDGE